MFILGFDIMVVLIAVVQVQPDTIEVHAKVIHALQGKLKEAHVISL